MNKIKERKHVIFIQYFCQLLKFPKLPTAFPLHKPQKKILFIVKKLLGLLFPFIPP